MEQSEKIMTTELTIHSPHENEEKVFTKKGKGEANVSRKSSTLMSKYSSSSRLTRSRILDTISTKNKE